MAARNARAAPTPPLTDPKSGLVFPNLNAPPFGGEEFKTNLIMPEPTIFLRRSLPVASIVRPTNTQGAALAIFKAVEAEEVFFAGLLDTVERPFRHEAESRRLAFKVNVDPHLPRSLVTDSKRLHQVLKNLLSNAFKFTEQGGVGLSVSLATGGWSADHSILGQSTKVCVIIVEQAPEIGPANIASRPITPPTAIPARSPVSFGPVETFKRNVDDIWAQMKSSATISIPSC